ncbi:MAG TPA: extracellular solute-binding protein [Clostridiales bacterium]|nr:extracellular solute-binding protein [Clostridiales bacterium]
MKIFNRIFTALVFLFLYAPLFVMMFFSFNEGKSTSVFEGFSFRWYKELFTTGDTMTALRNTLVLAICSAAIATVIGTITAVGIHGMKSKWGKKVLLTVNDIPMMNPDIVTGVSLMLLFVFVGRLIGLSNSLSFTTLLISHITFNIPYVILNIMPKLRQTDIHLVEAAQDLGCPPVTAFFKVVLPSISSGILSGAVMAFTLSLDDFIISYYTVGSDFQTLPLKIYAMTKKTVKPDMYALSSLMFIVILLLMVAVNLVSQDEKKKPQRRHTFPAKRVVAGIMTVIVVISIIFALTYENDDYESQIVYRSTYTQEYAGTVLNVFNWGEYISDGSDDSLNVNKEFEKLTGIKVNYTNYESNEAMYAKLKSDAVSYDIIIPSDYMIARLIEENMLTKLDLSKIDNYDLIDERYKGLYFDENDEYSIPYTVGLVGIIYNTTMVEGTPDSWSIMWDEKYSGQILQFNNSRDGFMTAQCLLGQDLNSTNKADWDAAAELLKEQSPILGARVMDEIFNKMESGNAAIAPYYAGDFLTMQEVNPDLEFFYPKEGTNVFVDSVCIPSSVQNYEAALMYINFLLEPEIALANAEYICYASPNISVVNNDNYSLKGDPYLYGTDADYPTQYYHNLDKETRDYYEALWEEIIRTSS